MVIGKVFCIVSMNELIKLKGLSRRGKTRISEHGDTFLLKEKEHFTISRFPDSILVESLNNTWRGEKWLGWLVVGRDVEILNNK